MKILSFKDIPYIVDTYFNDCFLVKKKHKDGYISYFNFPCSFDIETSSFYVGDEKKGCMYIWMLGLAGFTIVGRTWYEFKKAMQLLQEHLHLDQEKRIIIYVHNLSYEFQWMHKWFEWSEVFALDERKVCYCTTTEGVEFRCSYILSGYNLENLGKNLVKYKVDKLVGNLDYNMIRTSKTPLTDLEMAYCINDIKVVMAYIQEEIENNKGSIAKIPLTKTGYVRRYCRNNCLYGGESNHHKNVDDYRDYTLRMKDLTLTPSELKLQMRAYQGGFTHSNIRNVGRKLDEAGGDDFTSSYPATLALDDGYPMSKGEHVDITSSKQFYVLLKKYACIFDITFEGIVESDPTDNIIPSSKCWQLINPTINNGRVVKADLLSISITNIDFEIISQFYTWKSMKIGLFYKYKRGRLPKALVDAVLTLYEKKTTLKGVAGEEVNYMRAKADINSVYGMMVTSIVRPEYKYENGEWLAPEPTSYEEACQRYNADKRRFLFYPWGIFCTAFARRNLLAGIKSIGYKDYIYSDTDSIKYLHPEQHQGYFNNYNRNNHIKAQRAMNFYGFSIDRVNPIDIKGNRHFLGDWDFEGTYKHFKTLGAKRYIYHDQDDNFHITIAGLSKEAAEYMESKHPDVYAAFDDGLYVPAEGTGKLTHTYVDDSIKGKVLDYLGNEGSYYEKSFIHLSGCEFEISMAQSFVDLILNVNDILMEG